jgi:hypothetical protein
VARTTEHTQSRNLLAKDVTAGSSSQASGEPSQSHTDLPHTSEATPAKRKHASDNSSETGNDEGKVRRSVSGCSDPSNSDLPRLEKAQKALLSSPFPSNADRVHNYINILAALQTHTTHNTHNATIRALDKEEVLLLESLVELQVEETRGLSVVFQDLIKDLESDLAFPYAIWKDKSRSRIGQVIQAMPLSIKKSREELEAKRDDVQA